MIELTLEKAIELAENAVADRGADYVYTNPEGNRDTCHYIHSKPGEPLVVGCIVGHMLNQLGIDLHAINNVADILDVKKGLEEREILTMDRWASAFLSRLQRRQDDGANWLSALDIARGYALSE